jgi:hypothetical protein
MVIENVSLSLGKFQDTMSQQGALHDGNAS